MVEQIKPHLTSDDVFNDHDFPLTVLRRSPQIPFPKHTHDFSELVIVYGGRGTHFTEGEEYLISSGDVFILNGDRAHGYRELDDLQLVNVIFSRSFLHKPAFNSFDLDKLNGFHALFTWEPRLRTEHRFESRLRLDAAELARSLTYTERIEIEITDSLPGYKAIAYANFIQLCGFLSRCYDASTSSRMKELSRMSRVLNHLENNTDRSVAISEIINIAGMSESTMLRLFHKTTGVSPVEYHNRIRVGKICTMLAETDSTITEIAFNMGFSDSNYLTRLFTKIMGIPPGRWRKNHT